MVVGQEFWFGISTPSFEINPINYISIAVCQFTVITYQTSILSVDIIQYVHSRYDCIYTIIIQQYSKTLQNTRIETHSKSLSHIRPLILYYYSRDCGIKKKSKSKFSCIEDISVDIVDIYTEMITTIKWRMCLCGQKLSLIKSTRPQTQTCLQTIFILNKLKSRGIVIFIIICTYYVLDAISRTTYLYRIGMEFIKMCNIYVWSSASIFCVCFCPKFRTALKFTLISMFTDGELILKQFN